jgi:hypothetical protein
MVNGLAQERGAYLRQHPSNPAGPESALPRPLFGGGAKPMCRLEEENTVDTFAAGG